MAAQGGIVFSDAAADTMVLSNDHYAVTLSKVNGGLLSLVDRSAGQNLTSGSRDGCLWGAVFPGSVPDYVGGCSYSRSGGNRFSYTWDDSSATLTLIYTWQAGLAQWIDAVAQLTASTGPYFDLSLTIDNHWATTMQNVIWLSAPVFSDSQVQSAYGPFLMPGVRLRPGFFTGDRTYVPTYPSDAAFADYWALDVAGGHFAMYTINPVPNPVRPVALGFIDDDGHTTDTFYGYHSYHTWVPVGESWSAPQIRVRVGQPVEETILAYREENGIGSYPSLSTKLGTGFQTLARAPLIKADIHIINEPFRDWIPSLARLPSPSLLHPVAYQPGGHDESYPDFLPPEPIWGATTDFRAMVLAAQARGLWVMPYTNPTWWDEESPTIQGMAPLTIEDVALLDEGLQPVYETYGGHGGYVVSPQAPFVQQRLAQLMQQWQTEVPVNCVFEDQIGARGWRRDFNASASDAMAYSDGWLSHVAAYADRCLMTEMGWDRLAEDEIGFHGSLLTWQREFNYATDYWGTGNWEPFPLSVWLYHDKVLTYQHDLSHLTMSTDKEVLLWNMVFGMQLSYNWAWPATDPLGSPWLVVVRALQQVVVSRVAGQPMDSFAHLTGAVTRSDYGAVEVTGNWHATAPYAVGGYQLAPQGFLARVADDTALAGVFAGLFNAHALSSGEHYIIVQQAPNAVTIYHPIGSDTALTVDAPAAWPDGTRLLVRAVRWDGHLLGVAASTVQGGAFNVRCTQQSGGERVDHYWVGPALSVYLPLALRSAR